MMESTLGGIPRVQFSPERRKHYESVSDDLVDKALNVYDDFHGKKTHTNRWKLVKRKKGLNIYRERGRSKPSTDRIYLCSGVMPGTVEDMISGTYSDDMESLRVSLSIMTDVFLDARMVHVFDRNPVTSSVIFSGIKWMALKTPASATLIHDRDILFYNRIGRIVDRQGRYFVYCVMDSIELDEYPPNQQHNLVRSYLSMCYLFRQVQDELVGCFIMGNSSMGGTLPKSVGELITAARMLSVGNFLLVARAKAYSARIAQSADRIPSTSNACDVCMKKASLMNGSLEVCMGCRRNTCKRCREMCTVFRLDLRTQKPGKEKFCTQCISDVTRPTTSTFYMQSLNESTNSSIPDQSSTSMSSGAKQSSCASSSSHSHDYSEVETDVWLPAPSELPYNLHGLADFVDRANVAQSKRMRWNKSELEHYSEILRESDNVKAREQQSRAKNCMQESVPDTLIFSPGTEKSDQTFARSFGVEEKQQTFFGIDELD
ncbi:hypothetical protein PsorP6_017282 [Peronosclerospora sorghi]|uniref:Uncharacterized protein n=1 Tax=Peronosclerospora sorghi TaxID=230839 RepID=A0ACC0WLX4_9STRA|nr:hypothetical protein PsorP6_017282 [Peronosclerospora sorghi]